MPFWKYDPDLDLQELAAAIRGGLVVGTWQFPNHLRRGEAFPSFDGDRTWSWIAAADSGTFYATPGAALGWAGLPPFVEGYVRVVDSEGNRREPPYDLSEVEIGVLTSEQWKELAPLIGSPPSTL
jgi:hypothetical protein